MIVSEIQRLEKILQGLIDFTRRDHITPASFDPNELIRAILAVYQELLLGKDLRLEVNLGPEIDEIFADPLRFEQLVRNLLANAIEASPPGSVIGISTGVSIPSGKASETGQLEAENYFELKIRNSGAVIGEEDLRKIFSPFCTTKDYGTGIGLALAKKIAEDHKGSISAHSDSDGTTFTVWLPISEHVLTGEHRPAG